MKFSSFGEKFTQKSGILQLMDDLGNALSGKEKMLMLGGGNPAHIPEIETIWRKRMEEILANGDEYERMLGNYTTPQGDGDFIEAIATLFQKQYGWGISTKNVAILNGSQTSFFFLFNLFAGQQTDSSFKKILLPIVPEYIGYEDQGAEHGYFKGTKPTIEYIDKHTFKYRIDFEKLTITKDIAAICVSRPTNPTGNVITDDELERLTELTKEKEVPLIVDNAYGLPFPNIIFTKTSPTWENHVIFVMSLSKIGLPSTRTSIVIANEEVIRALSGMNAIISLSTSTIGQRIMLPIIKNGEVLKISEEIVKPFYQKKSEDAIAFSHKQMDPKIPYYLHKSEGALFLWLWCKDLPITSLELYERLKKKGVLIVHGNYFFPGLDEDWKHKDECIRITYSQDEETVKSGLKIIAKELKELYKVKS